MGLVSRKRALVRVGVVEPMKTDLFFNIQHFKDTRFLVGVEQSLAVNSREVAKFGGTRSLFRHFFFPLHKKSRLLGVCWVLL
jgi:hypothetical protein